VRVAAPPLDQPLPLPFLAQKALEPLPGDEATAQFSAAAALAAPMPWRQQPAPFLRLTIPDPFENHPAARLSTEWPESAIPSTQAPRAPRQ
jgi:hypothetical protein